MRYAAVIGASQTAFLGSSTPGYWRQDFIHQSNLGCRTFGTHTIIVRGWPELPRTNQTISWWSWTPFTIEGRTSNGVGCCTSLFWLSGLFKTSYIHTFTYGDNLWVVTKRMRSLIQAMEISFLRHGNEVLRHLGEFLN